MKISNTQRLPMWKYGLALLLLAGAALVVFSSIETRGAKTKEDLIDQYITAIRQENSDKILQLVPNSHIVTQAELDQVIKSSGGKTLSNLQTYAIPSESPQLEIVKLAGSYPKAGNSVNFITRLYVKKINDRWYLILGRDKNGLPTDAPSSKIN